MSSKLKKKKKPEIPVAFNNKADRILLAAKDTFRREVDRYTLDSYLNTKLISFQILHDKFGFAQKRIIRLEETIEKYLKGYADDVNKAPLYLADEMLEKNKLDFKGFAKELSTREKMTLVDRHIPGNKDLVRQLTKSVEASYFNYLSLSCFLLKRDFKFTVGQIRAYIEWIRYYVDSIARDYVDILGVASVLACECNYLDKRFENLVYEV